jgi:hypothetical protein
MPHLNLQPLAKNPACSIRDRHDHPARGRESRTSLRRSAGCRSRVRLAIHHTLVFRRGVGKGQDDFTRPGHVELLPRLLLNGGGILALQQVDLLLEVLVFLLKVVRLLLQQTVLPLVAPQGEIAMLAVDHAVAKASDQGHNAGD